MIFTSLITGISLWIPMRLLDKFVFDTTRTLPLIALTATTSLIGLGVYLFFSYLFRIDELGSLIDFVKRLKNWRLILKPLPQETPV
jgi:hypothetical protein